MFNDDYSDEYDNNDVNEYNSQLEDHRPKNNKKSGKGFYIAIGVLVVIVIILLIIALTQKGGGLEFEKYDIRLMGDNPATIYVNNEYDDPGCVLTSSKRGDLSSSVIRTGSYDPNTVGTYTLIYSYESPKKKSYAVKRTVNVVEFPLTVDFKAEPETDTNQDVLLTLNITGDDYSKVTDPEGNSYTDREIYYTASENATYTFTVYAGNQNTKDFGYEVTNIDKIKPNGSCTSTYTDSKIHVNVTTDKEVAKYTLSDGEKVITTSDSSEIVVPVFLEKAYVKVEDKAGNIDEFDCETTGIKDLEIFVVNYNSSDCFIVRTSSKVMVIDTSVSNAWSSRVKKALDGLGITKIDYLIGTHIHGDHIGNHINVIKNYKVDKIYFNHSPNSTSNGKALYKYLTDNKIKYSYLKQKDVFYMDNLKIEVFGPKEANQSDENKNSLNLKMTYGTQVFGWMGDGYQENILNDFGAEYLKFDWMKHPHHGISGLDTKFAKIFAPKYDVITCGADIFGQRHGSVKSALKNAGATFYYVYSSGDMRFTSDGKSIKVNTKIKWSDYKR